ncbi:hypothetical protein Lfu02_64690 [Longispora fulva]|nr:hypothetical protein Lfu02_64690 [Longispora fulva]
MVSDVLGGPDRPESPEGARGAGATAAGGWGAGALWAGGAAFRSDVTWTGNALAISPIGGKCDFFK